MESLPGVEKADAPAPRSEPTARPRDRPSGTREEADPPEYSIAAVSKLTGISCHALRVWERRHGFPVPHRAPSGHRRYNRGQVEILCRLIQVHRAHHRPIAELIGLLARGQAESSDALAPEAAPGGDDTVSPLLERLTSGDSAGAELEFARLASQYPPLALVSQVIAPGLVEAGEGWFRRSLSAFHERLITVFFRRKLYGLIDAAQRANGGPVRSVIAGSVEGDRHEGGVLVFHLAMELRGWRVHNLGVDLPVREYQAAVRDLRPSALALSFVLSRNINKRFQQLEAIRGVPVFVGGRSIVNYQSLARGHGLIPLAGPIAKSAELFQLEYDQWQRARSGPP